jgi:cell division protein FtsB
MSVQEARRVLPFSQLLLILMGILVVYLAADFVRQVAVNHQRQEELRQIGQDIERAKRETVELEGQLEYANSPDAVEEALRPQGLTREDEVLVVLVGAPGDPLPDEEQESNTETEFGSPREAWWDLFFGTR